MTARFAGVARTLARIVTALVAVEGIICLYVLLVGDLLLEIGPLRISAGTWRHPFTQAVVLAVVAALLYWRDATQRGEWDTVPRVVRRLTMRAMAPIRAQPVLWSGLLIGAVAAVVVCDRVAAQAFIVGSEAGRWVYPYIRDVPPRIALVVLACGLAFAFLLWRDARSGEWSLVAAWILVAAILQAALRSLAPFDFTAIFLSEGANSFYTVTQQYDAHSVLSRFAELRSGWPLHAHSNMPGKLVLLYLLEWFSNDPAVLSWVIVGISNLGGVLLYLWLRDVFADRRVARYSLALYLFVPSKLFFFPLMNTVTPVVAFACLLLVTRWLKRGGAAYGIAAGVSTYALVFFEPVPLVIGALILVVCAHALPRSWTSLRTRLGPFMMGFIAATALVLFLFNFNILDAIRRVGADAAAFNASEGRPYGVWAWRNLIEFFFGAGICQAVLFWFAAVAGVRSPAGPWLDRPIAVVCCGLLVMLLALDLGGINRGEAIRLWIFLACLFQVPAAWVCARLQSRVALAIVLMLTVVQAALATAMIGFVVP